MNAVLFRDLGVATLALVFYTIGVVTEQRKSAIIRQVIIFLTAGLIFDITSTALMAAGARNISITAYEFIRYSALAAMLINTILIWRLWSKRKVKIGIKGSIDDSTAEIPGGLHIYTRLAYSWWAAAYIASVIIPAMLQI